MDGRHRGAPAGSEGTDRNRQEGVSAEVERRPDLVGTMGEGLGRDIRHELEQWKRQQASASPEPQKDTAERSGRSRKEQLVTRMRANAVGQYRELIQNAANKMERPKNKINELNNHPKVQRAKIFAEYIAAGIAATEIDRLFHR
jgi:hypothetical protein